MNTAKLSAKYQVVIPREVRRKMRLEKGSRVSWYPLDDERVVLTRQARDPVVALRGLGKDLWRSLGGVKYLEQERSSWGK